MQDIARAAGYNTYGEAEDKAAVSAEPKDANNDNDDPDLKDQDSSKSA